MAPLPAFPWDDVLAVGLGLLRLSSKDFWSMTTREFAAIVRGFDPGGRLQRSDLNELMSTFPDHSEEQEIS